MKTGKLKEFSLCWICWCYNRDNWRVFFTIQSPKSITSFIGLYLYTDFTMEITFFSSLNVPKNCILMRDWIWTWYDVMLLFFSSCNLSSSPAFFLFEQQQHFVTFSCVNQLKIGHNFHYWNMNDFFSCSSYCFAPFFFLLVINISNYTESRSHVELSERLKDVHLTSIPDSVRLNFATFIFAVLTLDCESHLSQFLLLPLGHNNPNFIQRANIKQ